MEENRRSRKARSLVRVSVVWIVCVALALVAALPSAARADPAVDHIALMAFGAFAGSDGVTSFAAQVSCTTTNGCVGIVGFPFPAPFVLKETVTGIFTCNPSDSPTQCRVVVVSADIACDLTTSANPTPGISNPVHLDCTEPQGSGDGVTTLNLLL